MYKFLHEMINYIVLVPTLILQIVQIAQIEFVVTYVVTSIGCSLLWSCDHLSDHEVTTCGHMWSRVKKSGEKKCARFLEKCTYKLVRP